MISKKKSETKESSGKIKQLITKKACKYYMINAKAHICFLLEFNPGDKLEISGNLFFHPDGGQYDGQLRVPDEFEEVLKL